MNKTQKIIQERVIDGEWVGATDPDGNPVIILNDVPVDPRPLAKQFGISIKSKKSNKYKVEKQHADLEQPQHSGDPEDAGDGVSQSEE